MYALRELVGYGEVIERAGGRWLVASVNDDLAEAVAAAIGAAEDEEDNNDDEPDGSEEPSLGWSGGLQYRLDTAPNDLESDGDCDAEPDHEGPDGDEGDYSQHQLEPVDHDIRMMLRDNIDRKAAAKRRRR